jgi:hypothetical protein
MVFSSSTRALVSGAVLGAFLGACGGNSGGNGAGGTGGTGAGLEGGAGAGGVTGADAGPPCNNVVNGAPFVTPVDDPDGGATPPEAVGGTLASGTYYLTSSTYYPSSSCTPFSPTATTLVITAASANDGVLDLASGTATEAFTESISYSASGTSLAVQLTCINPALVSAGTSNTSPYSATPTTFAYYLPNSSCGYHVDVYTKQ